MDYRYSEFVRTISLILVFFVLLKPVSVFAKEDLQMEQQKKEVITGTYTEGRIDGGADAKGNPLWIIGGVGCGIFGLGAALIISPDIPSEAFIGKSSEYALVSYS